MAVGRASRISCFPLFLLFICVFFARCVCVRCTVVSRCARGRFVVFFWLEHRGREVGGTGFWSEPIRLLLLVVEGDRRGFRVGGKGGRLEGDEGVGGEEDQFGGTDKKNAVFRAR